MPLLLEHFLRRFAPGLEKDVRGFSPEALDILLAYPWPGNIRELQNVLRQALLNTVGPILLADFLPAAIVNHSPAADATSGAGGFDLASQIEEVLRRACCARLKAIYRSPRRY